MDASYKRGASSKGRIIWDFLFGDTPVGDEITLHRPLSQKIHGNDNDPSHPTLTYERTLLELAFQCSVCSLSHFTFPRNLLNIKQGRVCAHCTPLSRISPPPFVLREPYVGLNALLVRETEGEIGDWGACPTRPLAVAYTATSFMSVDHLAMSKQDL
jgi:hypothetical protein